MRMRGVGPRSAGRSWTLGLVLGSAMSVLPPGASLGAQEPGRCAECTEQARREASANEREVRSQARSLRKDIARLRRGERNEEMIRALREADAALEQLDSDPRRAQSTVARALGRVSAAQARADENGDRYAGMVQRLGELQGQLAGAMAMRSLAALQLARPAGWLGVAYSGEPPRSEPGRGSYFYYRTYPVIAAVDPGSPAEAAGLAAGDTMVAFNGDDVRNRKIFFSDVLRPGSTLRVRVRRGGDAREVRVAVKPRPFAAPLAEVYPGAEPRVRVRVNEGSRVFIVPPRAPRAPSSPGVPAVAGIAPLPPTPGTPFVVPPRPPSPPAPGYFIWNGPSAVAGAELARMNGDLRDALGVADGVLVLSVGGGSPASGAGLRAGDVILRAGGRPVTSPAAVQRMVERSDDRRLTLEVVRKKEKRTVVVRW